MIKAILFDLDDTLIDFSGMKIKCIEAAVDAMIDAGLAMDRREMAERIFHIYEEKGIEYQRIF